ncbi:MAG: hypothetical protein ABJC13_17635 [Acidobacteriota bacterium]
MRLPGSILGLISSGALQPGSKWLARASVALLVLGTVASALHAGVNRWTPSGVTGGTVTAVAFDPSQPAILYAGTADAGVWKSLDGGRSWRAASRGLDAPGRLRISDLDIDPRDPRIVLAATGAGLFRTMSGGESWVAAGPPVALLSRSPVAPSVLYATTREAILRSTDGGASWQPTAPLAIGFYVHDLTVDPSTSAVVYAATNGGVLKTVDGGGAWTLMNEGLSANPRAVFVVAIAVDPQTSANVYAANLDGATVFKSLDGGGHWRPSLARLGPDGEIDFAAITIDPHAPGKVLVAVNRFGQDVRGELWRTSDAGATWRRERQTPILQTVATSSSDEGTVVAGVYGRGLLISRDGGARWQAVTAGLTALGGSAVAVAPTSNPRTEGDVLVATTAGTEFGGGGAGLARRTAAGSVWQPSDLGLAFRGAAPVVMALAFDPDRPRRVYAASAAGIFASRDGGAHWLRAESTVGTLNDVLVTASGTVLAAGAQYVPCGLPFCGALPIPTAWQSEDGGSSWKLSVDGIDPSGTPSARTGFLRALAQDPTNGVTYAGGTALFVRSNVDGPWQACLADGLPRPVEALATLPPRQPIPGEPSPLLAAVGGPNPGLWRSTDGCRSFVPFGRGLPAGTTVHRFLASGFSSPSADAVPPVARILFAATSRGVFRSLDAGTTWQALGPRTLRAEVVGLDLQPGQEGGWTLYAATSAAPGLFEYSMSGARP